MRRFKRHRHLIWVIAEEYQERYTPRRVHDIAVQIRLADEFAHPIAVHKLAGLDFSEFAADPVIDQFAIQYDAPDDAAFHRAVVAAWQAAAGRYNLNLAESHPRTHGAATRRRNWAIAMGGAYTMVLGMDIAGTAVADLEDCGRLRRFMEATDFDRMAPRDDLAAAGTTYVLARPGESYIAYGADGPAALGLREMVAGRYDFTWFDPASGATVRWQRRPVTSGEAAWRPPPEIGAEVALHLRRSGR